MRTVVRWERGQNIRQVTKFALNAVARKLFLPIPKSAPKKDPDDGH